MEVPSRGEEAFFKNKQYGYWSLFRYASIWEKTFLAISGISAVCGGALIASMPIIYSHLASAILSSNASSSTSNQSSVRQILFFMIYLSVALFVSTGLAAGGFIYVGSHVTSRIRSQYLLALLRQPIAYFSHMGPGACNERLIKDINTIQRGICEKLAQALHAFGTIGTAWTIAFIFNWRLAAMMTWSVVVGVSLIVTSYKMNKKYSQPILDYNGKSTSIGEEAFSSVRTVKAIGAEDPIVEQFSDYLSLASKHGSRQRSIMGIVIGVLIGTNYLVVALSFWQGSKFLTEGKADFRDVFIIQIVIGYALFTLIGISGHAETFTKALASVQEVYSLIDQRSIFDATSKSGVTLENMEGRIEFVGVQHYYPSRPENMVLKGMNLIFPSGKTTALVGSSGSGKSSIVDLVERFYDPADGAILLDGHYLTTLNLQWLRRQIGIVDQHPGLFSVSIFDNIAFGLIRRFDSAHLKSSAAKRLLVENAAHAADAHDFIMSLPQSYDTLVSNIALSGGQRQRLALARALISAPKILILDEATSAIDTESEKRVVKSLSSGAAGRTTIVIAHRLSTIKAADNIIVVDDGCIKEQGTHSELLSNRGAYFNLIQVGEIQQPDEEEDLSVWCAAVAGKPLSFIGDIREKVYGGDSNGSLTNSPKEIIALPQHAVLLKAEYSTWALIQFIFSFSKHDLVPNIIGTLCCCFAAIEEAANAIFFSEAIVALALPPGKYGKLRDMVGFWSAMYLVLAVLQTLVFSGQGIAFGISSENMMKRVKVDTFRRILRQDVSWFDRSENSVGKLLTLLSSETAEICSLSGGTLGLFLLAAMTLMSSIVVACVFSWKLALVVTTTIPIILFCGYSNGALLRKLQDKTNKGLSTVAAHATEAISEIKTVSLLTMESHVWERYDTALRTLSAECSLTTIKVAAVYGGCQGLPFLCQALGMWYGNSLLQSGDLKPLQFFIAYGAIINGARSAGALFSFSQETSSAINAARLIKALWHQSPEIDTWSSNGLQLEHVDGRIEMRNVSFSYEGRENVVLQDVSLWINAGEQVALVGPSGSGKSSIIALLERFYNPTAGEIFVDGFDIKSLQLGNYRSFIGLVSQEIALYDGTIRENLVLGVPAELVSEEAIRNACIASNLEVFLSSLPQGLSTPLGTKGGTLSGGQKQRLSFARALLRNPKILLLDESTAALDSASEALILEYLRQERGKRTVLMIAHSLNAVKRADRIIVLEHGRIVEEGNHMQLLAKQGRYWDLFAKQIGET